MTMKLSLRLSFSVLFFALAVAAFAQKKPQFFTPKDATSWFYVLNDKSLNVNEVFNMKDGVLYISGESSGYLRTKKKYTNFNLNVEWRWTKVLANSGVLVHIQPKDSIWPACYQVQQKADAAGDIICMNGLWAKECTDSIKFTVKKMLASNEKPLGEWNSMKIVSKNKTLKVWVNGVLQNNISGLTVSNGYIGFQNEGKPLEFRKLTIK
jgi:hypothetical protein